LSALLLLLLQSVAPLLHAHAADDPRYLTTSGIHLPGLETVATSTGGRDVVSERTYPLIEEAACCLQRLTSEAITAPEVTAPQPDADAANLRTPLQPAGWHAATDCPRPPPRAPPHPLFV